MPTRPLQTSPLPLAIAALLTFGFVGCLSETRSLNDNPAAANGGEEGDNPVAGTGGKAASGAGTAGSGTHAGNNGMGTGGRSETGGTSGGGPRGGSAFGGSGALAGVPNGGSSGSPNGGVPNAGVGAMAGYSGNFAGGGPVGGSAGGAGAPSCVSSDGTGCDGVNFCIDHPFDNCNPDLSASCSGICALPYRTPECDGLDFTPCPRDFECLPDTSVSFPRAICVGGRSPDCTADQDCAEGFSCLDALDGKRCVPDRADCKPLDICDSGIPTCPPGFAPADAQVCDYVCVSFEHCGCQTDSDCPAPSSCDRVNGRCFVAHAPSPRCLGAVNQPDLPAGSGADVPRTAAYAFVDGECKVASYGAGENNDNRFPTMEECISTCQGMPIEQSCRGTRKAAEGCLACGAGGGCMLLGQFCFEPCESNDDCTTQGYFCIDNICQVGGCF